MAGRPWALITAFNPGSIPRDRAGNEAAQAELVAVLAGHQTLPAEGRSADGTWREPGLLVIGIERDAAVAIGRRFGQAAIVAGEGGEPPRLVRCEAG